MKSFKRKRKSRALQPKDIKLGMKVEFFDDGPNSSDINNGQSKCGSYTRYLGKQGIIQSIQEFTLRHFNECYTIIGVIFTDSTRTSGFCNRFRRIRY